MTVIGEATVAVRADTKGFGAEAEKGMTAGMGSALKKLGAVIAVAGIGKAFASLLASSVTEARESNKVAAQTAQVIKTTGGVAHVSAGQIDALSNALSAKSGIDDEVIASSEAVLLTFTKVRNEVGSGNDVFNQASAAALDMSVALGTDLQGATLQLGKALNDPIKGITALARAGVSFTAEQKATIKQLTETGDLLGAQKIILGELATEFGGQAAAQATAADKARVAWSNYKEEIGKRLIPVIDAVFTKFSEMLPALTSGTIKIFDGVGRIIQAVKPEFEALGNVVGPLKTIVGEVFKVVGEVLRDVFNPALENLVPNLKGVNDGLVPATNNFGDFLSTIAGNENAINGIATAVSGLAGALIAFKVASAVGSAVSGISALVGGFGTALPAIANPVGLIVAGIVALGVAGFIAYKKFKPFHDLVDTIGRFFRDTLWPILQRVAEVVGGALATAFRVVSGELSKLGPVLTAIGGFLKTVFVGAIDAIGPVIEHVAGFISGLVSGVAGAVGPIGDAIGRWFGPALDKVMEVGGAFLGWLNEHVLPVIVAAGEFFAAVWTRVSEIVSVAFGVIMAVVGPVVGFIIDALSAMVNFMLGVLGPVFDVIGGIISFAVGLWWTVIKDAFDIIWNVVSAVLPSIIDIIKIAFETIWHVIEAVFVVIKGVIEGALSIIQGIFQFFTGLLTGDWGKAWDGIKNIVSGAWEIVKSVIQGALNIVTAIISGAQAGILAVFSGIWAGVKAGVSTFIEDLVGFFTSIPGRLLALVETIGKAALDIGKAIIKGIGDGLGAIGGFVTNIADKLQHALTSVLNNFVIDPINAGIRGVFSLADAAIPDFISSIGGANAPQISRLEAGALVKARAGGTLAVIAEGGRDEAVVPLDPGVRAGLAALATNGGAGTVMIDATIHVQGNVYGVEDLNAYLDQRDNRLAELLSARRGR